jgi:hypothetical protein
MPSVRKTIIACAMMLGLFPLEATAQLANITIATHPTATTSKTYRAQIPVGSTVEKAMQQAGMQYTATWYASVGGYALMIAEGTPPSTNGGFGSPFWWLCLNNRSVNSGMSAQPVNDGDRIDWYFITVAKCTGDTGAPPH